MRLLALRSLFRGPFGRTASWVKEGVCCPRLAAGRIGPLNGCVVGVWVMLE